MARKFKAIHTTRIPAGIGFTSTKELPEVIHLQDLALDAIIDLHYIKPLIISSERRMYDARMMMQGKNNIHHLHVIFVIDEQNKLVGFLSLAKILTEFPIKVIEEDRVKRQEVLVKDVMRPIEQVATLNYDDLRLAKVGDIVETFKEEDQYYILVIKFDEKTKTPTICGMYIASFMGMQLGIDILSVKPDRAKTLAELNHIMLHE